VRRYRRERLGELTHLDITKLGCFDQPGHRITDTRAATAAWAVIEPLSADGPRAMTRVHVAVDDATRQTYVEALGVE